MKLKLNYTFDELQDIDWSVILPIIIPFIIIDLLLKLIAIIDLYKHRKTRKNVLLWSLIIIFVNTIGPIIYFAIGRKDV